MYCSQCGINLPPSSYFCPRCGLPGIEESVENISTQIKEKGPSFPENKRKFPARVRLSTPKVPSSLPIDNTSQITEPRAKLPAQPESSTRSKQAVSSNTTIEQAQKTPEQATRHMEGFPLPSPPDISKQETDRHSLVIAQKPSAPVQDKRKPEQTATSIAPTNGQVQNKSVYTPQVSKTNLTQAAPEQLPQVLRTAQNLVRQPGRRRQVLLVAAIVLFTLIGSLLYSRINILPGTSQNPQHASTSQTNAYQDIYILATSGIPVLRDSLQEQSATDWDIYEAQGGGECTFQERKLFVSTLQKGVFVPCYAQISSYNNFALEVDVSILQGEEAGIFFRSDDQKNTGYSFRISSEGTYNLFMHHGNGTFKSLLTQKSTEIYRGSDRANTLTIVAQQETFYFYINKKFVGQASNSVFPDGKIALLAALSRDSGFHITEAAFKNLRIWQLQTPQDE